MRPSLKFLGKTATVLLAGAAAVQPLLAEPVSLPAGTNVLLVLQHHLNSGYTPAGTPVYFRVADDVLVGDQVLIAKNSLVVGQMAQASERGMVGRSGTMLVSVDSVPGVDGTRVSVDADLSKQGRSRGAATVGWTIFWGIPGLITKGVNPYMEKGDVLSATVTSATPIDPAKVQNDQSPQELGTEYAVTQHRWARDDASDSMVLDIERDTDLKDVAFTFALPADVTDPAPMLDSLRLYAVDGVRVPEEIRPSSVQEGAAIFDAWSIARYCNNGNTSLQFTGTDANGRSFHANRDVLVEIRKKKPKT